MVGSSWPEKQDRKAYEDLNLDELPFDEERAVFPLSLLMAVATIRKSRSRKPVDHGVNLETYPYALTNITYCAHCEKQAEEQHDLRLRAPGRDQHERHTALPP